VHISPNRTARLAARSLAVPANQRRQEGEPDPAGALAGTGTPDDDGQPAGIAA